MAIAHSGENTAMINEPPEDKTLIPSVAAEYLRQQWGIDRPFSSKDFSNFCWNNKDRLATLKIAPDYAGSNLTLWKRSMLDKIIEYFPAPELRGNYGKPATPRKAKEALLDIPQM